MGRYILKRLMILIPVLLIAAVVAFFITNLMPGDPVRLMLGDYATEQQVAEMTARLGFDKPLYIRFFIWVKNVLKGDFGSSIFLDTSVTKAILSRLEPTMLLAVTGLFFGLLIGIPLGMVSATKKGSLLDKLSIGISLIGISIPSFFIAIVLILFFGVYLRLLPVSGYVPVSQSGFGVIKYLILPGFSLGLMQSGLIARMTRSAMLDVLSQNYIRTARAKGLGWPRINFIHALRNAMAPVITVIGFSLAALMGGTWIIETVFNIPGVGALAINSILRRDYAVIQGCMLFSVVVYILVNLLVDIIYALINPAIRYDS
ncbi:MAG: ABC transporter permease [Clostridiales bacterium]|jgi:peptide/nickel transport system permease protein|nr:ABC transporter permease [Clostridiales bacterium]